MKKMTINGSTVTILPVVKGLVSEGDVVAKTIAEVKPDAVAVSISREELSGLKNKSDYEKYEMSDLEDIYAAILETFGQVELPPPCFVRGLDICTINGIPILPLDMNEELYTETYCENVTATDMMRESMFSHRAYKRRYDLTTPQNFALDWDRRVNKASGFRELERTREKHMASALENLCRKYHNVLAIIECERADGVLSSLGTHDVGSEA